LQGKPWVRWVYVTTVTVDELVSDSTRRIVGEDMRLTKRLEREIERRIQNQTSGGVVGQMAEPGEREF